MTAAVTFTQAALSAAFPLGLILGALLGWVDR